MLMHPAHRERHHLPRPAQILRSTTQAKATDNVSPVAQLNEPTIKSKECAFVPPHLKKSLDHSPHRVKAQARALEGLNEDTPSTENSNETKAGAHVAPANITLDTKVVNTMPAATSGARSCSPKSHSPSARDSVYEQSEQVVEAPGPGSPQTKNASQDKDALRIKHTIRDRHASSQPAPRPPPVRRRAGHKKFNAGHRFQDTRTPTSPRQAPACQPAQHPPPPTLVCTSGPQDASAMLSLEPHPSPLPATPSKKGPRRENKTKRRSPGWATKVDFATLEEREYNVSTWSVAASRPVSSEQKLGGTNGNSDDGRGLRGWDGSLAPAPIDRTQRFPFADKQLAETVRAWQLAVNQAMEGIPQHSPVCLRLYLQGKMWSFVEQDKVGITAPCFTMGDITPVYWVPGPIEGKAPLAFVRQLRSMSKPLRDCFQDMDADDEGDGLWWYHRVEGGYFLRDDVRPPNIAGPHPEESSTDVVARLNDFGSNKNAARWRRRRDRRKKGLERRLEPVHVRHHESNTDVVARGNDFASNKDAAGERKGKSRCKKPVDSVSRPRDSNDCGNGRVGEGVGERTGETWVQRFKQDATKAKDDGEIVW